LSLNIKIFLFFFGGDILKNDAVGKIQAKSVEPREAARTSRRCFAAKPEQCHSGVERKQHVHGTIVGWWGQIQK
jgi:hypothetical protein